MQAESAVADLRTLRTGPETINLLTGESNVEKVLSVPSTDQRPGISKMLGAVVGGVVGFAFGYVFGTLIVPHGGPTGAIGTMLGIFLAAVGAFVGGVIGRRAEISLTEGIPRDELYFYEDALRQGRSVVIVTTGNTVNQEVIRGAMEKAGAESIDRAREKWWIGIRDAEKEHYDGGAATFDRDEIWFRRGFEAALDPRNRGKSYSESRVLQVGEYPHLYDEIAEGAFRHGYARGQAYLSARRETAVARTA
jgi:hypothetical protein